MGTEVEEFLAEMLPKRLSADHAYHNGDVQPRLATGSHRDPVTLCGAVVPLKSSWDNLNQTFASLASRFAESSNRQNRGACRWRQWRSRLHGRAQARHDED